MRIDKLNEEIERAKTKAAQWQARVKDLERKKTEQENLEILQTVRGIAASPEEIQDILTQLRSAKELPYAAVSTFDPNKNNKEEPTQ